MYEARTKGERTRAALVAAAIKRFAMDGYQRTSVAEVARDVGMTAGAPYRYFPDKEALFLAAVDADGEEMVKLVRANLFAHLMGQVSTVLGELTELLSQALDDHPLVARVMSGQEPMGPERIHALPNLAALRSELATFVLFGQRAGRVRPSLDPAQVALGLETAVLYQLAYIATLRGSDSQPDTERWGTLARLIEIALEPPPVEPPEAAPSSPVFPMPTTNDEKEQHS
ncbi:MAG: TetR/AcrR family transcriptional regulator [Acidimicrobiales bacterium]